MYRIIVVCFALLCVCSADSLAQDVILEFNSEKQECVVVSRDSNGKRHELGAYDVVFPKAMRFSPIPGVVEQSTFDYQRSGAVHHMVKMKMFGIHRKEYTFYIKGVSSLKHVRRSWNTFYMEEWYLSDLIHCIGGNRAVVFVMRE